MRKKVIVFLGSLIFCIGLTINLNALVSKSVIIPYTLERMVTATSILERQKPLDIVFIGDSKTKYQIDSEVIKSYTKVNIYNAGINGFNYAFWPTISKKAIDEGAHTLIFSISPTDLFDTQDLSLKVGPAVGEYGDFEQMKAFFYSRKKVSLNVISLYLNAAFNNIVNLNYIRFFVTNYLIKSEVPMAGITCKLKTELLLQSVYNCSNDDGYIITKQYPKYNNKFVNYTDNSEYGNSKIFLEYMIKQAKARNVNVIILLIPNFGIHTKVNAENISTEFGVPVIDLSNVMVNEADVKYWSADEHLNNYGRKKYSELVAKSLVPILASQKTK